MKAIHDHHHIDLVDMNKMSVIYKGKTEKYIFSLLHVFPRFHWLLEIKHSSGVKRKLKKMYTLYTAFLTGSIVTMAENLRSIYGNSVPPINLK